MNSEIRKILNANRAQKSFYTHTSMVTPKGIFAFPHDQLDRFWTVFSTCVFKDSDSPLGLQEVSQQYMPLIADIDIKVELSSLADLTFTHIPDPSKIEPGQNIYSEEQLRATVRTYQTAVKKVVQGVSDRELTCVVLEKPSYIKTYSKKSFLSNGFHLHFPWIFLDKNDIQIFIHPLIRSCLDRLELYKNMFGGGSSKVIDDGIFSNPWLMYGSRKSIESQPYAVSKVYDHEGKIITLPEAFENYLFYDQCQKAIKISKDISYYLPRILSIFPYHRPVKGINPSYKAPAFVMPRPKKEKKEYEEIELTEAVSILTRLLPLLNEERVDDFNEWIRVGWIIYNVTDGAEEGRAVWKTFSERSDKYNEIRCDYYWDKMEKGGYTIGTLKYLAKLDSPKKYAGLMRQDAKKELRLNLSSGSHYDIARVLHKLHGEEFVCANISKQIWYWFDKHHWDCIDSGVFLRNKISEEVLYIVEGLRKEECKKKSEADDDLEKTMHDKRIQYIDKLREKLKNSPYKDNIMKESRYIFADRDFIDKLDANPNLIPFKNGVYDFVRNEFRPGKPDDYFSKTLPINYNVDLTLTDRRVEEVLNFFKTIFPDADLRNYFLDNLSEIFEGGNPRKLIFMWQGGGDNGKTVTQTLIEKMLGRYAVKLPTTLITGRKPNVGAAFPEIARLAGVRWATMEEPDAHEKINIGTFKNLTGNDTLIGRDLYESGKAMREIVPQFKVNFIVNNLPFFESADKATWNRVRVIPFEARLVKPSKAPESEEEQMRLKIFPKDRRFADKIPGMVEALAWYLIYHRFHFRREDFYEPKKVKMATREYRNNNDFVGQFVAEYFVEEESAFVSLDEIYPSFRTWYRENMSGTAPTRKHLRDSLVKAWGEPVNPGCRWPGYRHSTLQDQLDNKTAAIIP